MTVRTSTGLRNAILQALTARPAAALFPSGFFINLYSGAQPASPDAAITDTLIAHFSVNGDNATALQWEASGNVAAGVIPKLASQTWQDAAADAAGTVGYFRLYESGDTPASASSTAKRIDGSITVTGGGGDVEMTQTTIAAGAPVNFPSFSYSFPA